MAGNQRGNTIVAHWSSFAAVQRDSTPFTVMFETTASGVPAYGTYRIVLGWFGTVLCDSLPLNPLLSTVCDQYLVTDIQMVPDTTGLMFITFINYGDSGLYKDMLMITNDNDTIVQWSTFSGGQPDSMPYTMIFQTTALAVPEYGTYRIALGFQWGGITICDSLPLSPALGASQLCNCYAVNDIQIPTDATGVMDITFTNSCDSVNGAYLEVWVITDSGDTIATNGGPHLSLVSNNIPETHRFNATVSALPPAGTFRVAFGGSLDCDSIAINSTVGINNVSSSAVFRLFPNPSADLIEVRGDFATNVRYIIFNSAGKVVQQDHLNGLKTIRVSELNSGSYFLQIIGDNKNFGGRVFIKW